MFLKEEGDYMYNAIDLAKYIVTRCLKQENPISNLQLQKILYYIQKDFIKRDDLAFSEAIEAWQFGPVVPIVYYYFCAYGAMPITENYEIFIEDKDVVYINSIIDEKSVMDPWDLVSDTHKQNGAWYQIYKDGSGNHCEIPVALIKEAG